MPCSLCSRGFLFLGSWVSVHHDTGAAPVALPPLESSLCPFVGFACSRGLREGNDSFYLKGCVINKANTK